MLFSSAIFLFYFLPLLLLFYFLVPGIRLKNTVLLLFSLLFFSWGGLYFTAILAVSVLFNFVVGRLIEKFLTKKMLVIGIAGNLALLLWFKYANFFTDNLNFVLGAFNTAPLYLREIILPVGISFYSFHSISYLVDVYYKKSPAQKNILDMALYIILFSQLVAGPIIRYNVFEPQLLKRRVNLLQFAQGVERFIIGLAKKVLIANTLARLADEGFSQPMENMGTALSWMSALAYTFQIYFDFSGYSDMAIGLSKLFGFDFPENFNLPYTATSIRDFWQRWHISLSSFFRDYVYIELGGNKKGKRRTYLNLIAVFLLTGFWHGANYTFIVWGMVHGGFLLLERAGFDKVLKKFPMLLQGFYTFLIVLLAWVPFRAANMQQAFAIWKSMFSRSADLKTGLLASYFTTDMLIVFALAIVLSFNLYKYPARVFQKTGNLYQVVSACFLLAILFLSAMYVLSGTYNPFIYYQF